MILLSYAVSPKLQISFENKISQLKHSSSWVKEALNCPYVRFKKTQYSCLFVIRMKTLQDFSSDNVVLFFVYG